MRNEMHFTLFLMMICLILVAYIDITEENYKACKQECNRHNTLQIGQTEVNYTIDMLYDQSRRYCELAIQRNLPPRDYMLDIQVIKYAQEQQEYDGSLLVPLEVKGNYVCFIYNGKRIPI